MTARYINLKGYDWNFDYSRKQRFEIKGKYVMLPEEVGDAFPMYFKKESVVVMDEPKQVTEDVKVVVDEPKEEVIEELPVVNNDETVIEVTEEPKKRSRKSKK